MLLPYHNVRYTLLQDNRASRRRIFGLVCKVLAVTTFTTIILTLGFVLYKPTLGPPRQILIPTIPQKFPVKALVFYGRRSRVSILDCYLRVRIPIPILVMQELTQYYDSKIWSRMVEC